MTDATNLITAEGLQSLNAEGSTIAMVTHSPSHADMARRKVEMLDGRVVLTSSQSG